MGESDLQDDQAWYTCTAAEQLSETGLEKVRTASEWCNKGDLTVMRFSGTGLSDQLKLANLAHQLVRQIV